MSIYIFWVRFEQSTVATYGGISKLFIIHIRFYLFFVSLTKYAGRKLNTMMWLRMTGEFISIYLFKYDLSSQLWIRMAGYLNYS